MEHHKLRQFIIKKAEFLIENNIGDKNRLEQIQLKCARGLPLLSENHAYLDSLVSENISEEQIQSIKKDVENSQLEKYDVDETEIFHCISCGKTTKKLDSGGMCAICYLDYNIKISKFITKPTGGGGF